MLTVETIILRSDTFAQENLISVAPTVQNLGIGLRMRQSGKSKVPVEAAWRLAKSILKLEENKAAFLSPSEKQVLACINS